MRLFFKLLITLIVLNISFEVLAIDMDYYAPNGLPTISDTFTRLALIFSDGDYVFAFPIIGALSMIFVVINGYLVKPLTSGGKTDNPINIFAPLAIGSVIWFAGFVPTATMHIYDPVKNETQSVAGIPQAIVLIAGLTNILERNMIEITETGTAYPYSETAGGINLELFVNAQFNSYNNRKKFLIRDIQAYYEDCGKVNLVLPGNQTFEDMMSNTPELYSLISEWKHPSLFVNLYNGSAGKTNMSCTDAWNNVIQPGLNVTVFDKDVANICAKSGFDPLKAVQLQQCKNRLGELKKIHKLPATTANNYLRDSFIASTILKKINLDDPIEAQQTLMRRQLSLQGLGALNTSEDTMPNIKAVMTSIVLGIIPFLMLFLLTPLWSKALKFMAGSLLWITTWGIMMAVMHTATMDQSMTILSDIAANKMGLDAFMLAQTDGVKAFMLFGKMQSNSLMMATAIAIAVYGFGSYAMTGIAQGQAQSIQHIGESAAQQALTPEGRLGLRSSLAGGVASDSSVQYNSLSSGGGGFSDTGSYPLIQSSLGRSAEGVASGLNTNISSHATKGESSEGSITGQSQAIKDIASNSNTSVFEQSAQTAQTNTLTAQANAEATEITQNKVGSNNQADGAKIIAEQGQGYAQGQIEKSQFIAKMTGQDGSNPETIRNISENMALNNGAYAMTGQEIKDSDIMDKLSRAQQRHLDSGINYSVTPTFDEKGSLNDNVGIVAGVNIREDNNITQTEDNIQSAVTRVDTSSHFDGATMLSAMQNGFKDENYRTIEERFNKAKNVGNDPADDNKAARFNLLKDTLYGFADVTNREETSDGSRWSNQTGIKAGFGGNIPFTKIGGEVYSNSAHDASTGSTESHSIDATWGKINEIYEQSNTAHEFLAETNKFHNSQRETMENMNKEGDLSQDNPINQEQKQQQSGGLEQSATEDEQRIKDYLATRSGG
ncbi:hypothetical protein MS2017_1364 [Bathymodiolus thermophilus thioautotrophic gill symbiont]|uniref:TraG N-terminal Proteobacteria domain-containing protein n=1 Tax=Bathymodiolus thermophilus thioautotrophic gill symbiont TaxID=2360 RepID=A0A3G3INK2_9GAMM|nr:conjugal transfer protein TraG N-terminal domain-containing protein [Bathymodiolus thermophilus thioautotrophic gill symbiont]AYQ57052.1 hypothetical protein MS2017_1364 [Bathymodiolus thermophilus thioautotrophic gill symbiont]